MGSFNNHDPNELQMVVWHRSGFKGGWWKSSKKSINRHISLLARRNRIQVSRFCEHKWKESSFWGFSFFSQFFINDYSMRFANSQIADFMTAICEVLLKKLICKQLSILSLFVPLSDRFNANCNSWIWEKKHFIHIFLAVFLVLL